VRELPQESVEGLAALERLSDRAQKYSQGFDDFDQRPRYPSEPSGGRSFDEPPARNKMRFARDEPATKPTVKIAAPGVDGLGPGARVKHPTFGVGTVEGEDGAGQARKLDVRFGPGVGLKKVLARFVEKA